jgi:hypothetical protein
LLALLDVAVDGAWKALDPAQRRGRTLGALRQLLLREVREQRKRKPIHARILAIAQERVVVPWHCLAEGIMDDSAPDRSKRLLPERIDIRVGVERRRPWGHQDKLRIVSES